MSNLLAVPTLAALLGLVSCTPVWPDATSGTFPRTEATPTAGSSRTHDFQELESSIRGEVESGALPSVAFAIAHNGQIVHENAFGWADKEAHIASTVNTPYPLASTSKPTIATAAMVLVEQKRIDLQAPPRRYADSWFPQPRKMRADPNVRQLLNHTSGIGTYASIYWDEQQLAVRSLEESFHKYGFAAQKPGVIFEYSNLGYGLVGHLIAQRSGTSLGEFLDTAVFAPLGMDDSMLVDSFAQPTDAAMKYGPNGARLVETYNDTPGAGNVYASAHDLVLFGAFHLGNEPADTRPILSRRNRELMRSLEEPGATYPYYDASRYGLGWYFRTNAAGENVVWHEGGMPGASTILILLPDRGIVASVVINATDANASAQNFANALIHVLHPDYQPTSFNATDGFSSYDQQDGFPGRWEGEIVVDGAPVPWAFDFQTGGSVQVEFLERSKGSNLPAKTTFPALINGNLLVATFPATLPASDVEQSSDGYVLLRLLREGDDLRGAAVAYASPQRLEHLYPFAARLHRKDK